MAGPLRSARGHIGWRVGLHAERLLIDKPVTLQEIADRHGVSRERIRQNEKRLLGKLREYLPERVEGIEGMDFSISES